MNSYELNYMEKSQLRKRFESLAWRIGMMAAVMSLSWFAENIGLFNLPVPVEIGLGLIAAEISKAINNRIQAEPTY